MGVNHLKATDIAIRKKSPSRPYYAIEAAVPCWREDRHTAIAEAAYFMPNAEGLRRDMSWMTGWWVRQRSRNGWLETADNSKVSRLMIKIDFQKLRAQMVERHIAHRGVRSALVLDAMRSVPREEFLPEDMQEFAYEDTPLPIAEEQTISQPYIVAVMTEALGLEGGERVLEIGTGSGYAAAVLAGIAKDVYTVERIGQLAEKSAATVSHLGYNKRTRSMMRSTPPRRPWPRASCPAADWPC